MKTLLIGTLVGVLALAACDRQGPMPTAPYPPPVASLDKTGSTTETETETETTATRAKPLTRPNSPDKPMTRGSTSPGEPPMTATTPPNTAPAPAGGPTEN